MQLLRKTRCNHVVLLESQRFNIVSSNLESLLLLPFPNPSAVVFHPPRGPLALGSSDAAGTHHFCFTHKGNFTIGFRLLLEVALCLGPEREIRAAVAADAG